MLVLLNQRSGTLASSDADDEVERIAAGFADHGVTADVRSVEPAHLADTVVACAREGQCVAVVVGGGDGTINTVANAVAGTKLALGVLPLGTHNHFAKEMGVPEDMDAAVAALADALRRGDAGLRPLDVAEVNGHLFLNFSGVGLHPKVVEQREHDHAELKKSWLLRTLFKRFTKPLALVVSFVRLLGTMTVMRLILDLDGKRLPRATPSVIIAHNTHQIRAFGLHEISVVHRDVLNVYVARTTRVIGLLRLVLAAAFHRLPGAREFESLPATDLTVRYRRPTVKVTVDGEVMRMKTPLCYKIRKAGLTIVSLAKSPDA